MEMNYADAKGKERPTWRTKQSHRAKAALDLASIRSESAAFGASSSNPQSSTDNAPSTFG
jgi:hypothetical protein